MYLQLRANSIYLEEDLTKHVEFPIDGKFTLTSYGRFAVKGEEELADMSVDHSVDESPRPFTWSIPRPWSGSGSWSAGPSTSREVRSKKSLVPQPQPYDLFLKKTIPYVSLCLDQSGRNIQVEQTIINIYIKIPENSVSVQSILAAVATKVSCEVHDLVMLDVKFVEITDDKGEVSSVMLWYNSAVIAFFFQILTTGKFQVDVSTLPRKLNMKR